MLVNFGGILALVDTLNMNNILIDIEKKTGEAMFPGSTVKVYEWVESAVAPEAYTGPGTPRDAEDFVTIDSYDEFANL